MVVSIFFTVIFLQRGIGQVFMQYVDGSIPIGGAEIFIRSTMSAQKSNQTPAVYAVCLSERANRDKRFTHTFHSQYNECAKRQPNARRVWILSLSKRANRDKRFTHTHRGYARKRTKNARHVWILSLRLPRGTEDSFKRIVVHKAQQIDWNKY
jgi:hypothetical protein